MESDLGLTHKNLLSLSPNNKDEKWGRQNDSAENQPNFSMASACNESPDKKKKKLEMRNIRVAVAATPGSEGRPLKDWWTLASQEDFLLCGQTTTHGFW